MRKPLLFALLVVVTFSVYGQDSASTFSFNFQETPLKDALLQIETKTGFQVFIIEDWVQQEVVSGQLINLELSEVLNAVLKETSLNYTVFDNRIILTLGAIVVTSPLTSQ